MQYIIKILQEAPPQHTHPSDFRVKTLIKF